MNQYLSRVFSAFGNCLQPVALKGTGYVDNLGTFYVTMADSTDANSYRYFVQSSEVNGELTYAFNGSISNLYFIPKFKLSNIYNTDQLKDAKGVYFYDLDNSNPINVNTK